MTCKRCGRRPRRLRLKSIIYSRMGFKLTVRPVVVKQALKFNTDVHRRLPSLQGGMWALALEDDGELVGVCIVGRPTARLLSQDGRCLQVLRVAVVEGKKNGCSMLYGAAARAARAMGATDMFTFIHDDENGVSLKASGWIEDVCFQSLGGEWSRPSRPRNKTVEPGGKKRYWAPWSAAINDRP